MSVKIDSSVIFSLSIKKLSNFLSSVKLIKVSGLNFVLKMEIKSVEKLNPYYLNIEHKINKNENLNEILEKYDIPKKEINKIIIELKKHTNLSSIKIGEIIYLTLKSDTGGIKLKKLKFPISEE